MNHEANVSLLEALKQARSERLNQKSYVVRVLSGSTARAAQQKIDRLCSTRFANAVAASLILHSEEELIAFASLPNHLIGKADLAGVHDADSLRVFLEENRKEQSC